MLSSGPTTLTHNGLDGRKTRMIESGKLHCKDCGKETSHIYTGKSFPRPLRWRCSVCGGYSAGTP